MPEEIAPPTDIYSLGVVLYELLTGRLPFEGNMMSVIAQIVSTPPRRPIALNATVDLRLEAICLKMMAKRPAERYATMAAVAQELGRVLDQLSQAPLARAQAERYAATPDREPQVNAPSAEGHSPTLWRGGRCDQMESA